MVNRDLARELQAIANDSDFSAACQSLIDAWPNKPLHLDDVEAILRFMEKNEGVDFGSPGALVRAVEKLHRAGYEQLLLDSLERKPTTMTVWMLNRVINGSSGTVREEYVRMMRRIAKDSVAGTGARAAAAEFIDHIMRTGTS